MAMFETKFGKLYWEKSEKENALNLGVESAFGSGFVSVPLDRRRLLRAAGVVAATAALRGMKRRKNKAKRDRGASGKRSGFGGGKRR